MGRRFRHGRMVRERGRDRGHYRCRTPLAGPAKARRGGRRGRRDGAGVGVEHVVDHPGGRSGEPRGGGETGIPVRTAAAIPSPTMAGHHGGGSRATGSPGTEHGRAPCSQLSSWGWTGAVAAVSRSMSSADPTRGRSTMVPFSGTAPPDVTVRSPLPRIPPITPTLRILHLGEWRAGGAVARSSAVAGRRAGLGGDQLLEPTQPAS